MCAFKHSSRILTLIAVLTLPVAAQAGINGFGDFSGFSVNAPDSQTPPIIAGGEIELITGKGEYRSIFYNAPQSISAFTASFTYRTSNTDPRDDAGAAFVIQNSPQGANAVSSGSFLGYTGIPNSAAITLEIGGNQTGFYKGGTAGGSSASVNPVNLLSGDPINVTLAYNGTTLTEKLVDSVTSATFSTTYLVTPPLSSSIGNSNAYVGFTAANGANFGADRQYFSNFTFVPEPSTMVLLAIGIGGMTLRRRRTSTYC
jgi:PEP-CTERM motif